MTPTAFCDEWNGSALRGLGHISVQSGWNEEMLRAFRTRLSEAGCFIGEVTLYRCGWALAQSDEAIRQDACAKLIQGLRDAVTLEAHCVGVSTIAGDPGPDDPWSAEVWGRLVSGVAQVAAEAENVGMDLGFHPGNRGPLDRPEQLRKLVDDVASPRVKVILDPVNMTDHRNVYDSTGFINYLFDLLGPDMVAAHAKDVRFDDTHLITKIDEVPLGTGRMDYETYLRRFSELDEELVFCIEHFRDVGVSGTSASPVYIEYPDSDVENRRASDYIHQVADATGIIIS